MARNTKGLETYYKKKTEVAINKVNITIDELRKNGRKINFNVVAKESGVAKTFLYENTEIKEKIQTLRNEEVNNEIKPLYDTVKSCINSLNSGGRLCIITFHSLEDRAVKKAYVDAEGRCTCPSDLPYCVCNKVSFGRIINKKPIIATNEEQEENSRSKSAKLRIFEKF